MIPGRPVDGAAGGAGCSNGPVGGGCGGGRRRAAQRTVDLRVALEKDGGELRDSQHRGCDCAPGTCDDTNPDCPCIASLNFCEVYCACGPSCRNRFYGCKCTKDCATMACPSSAFLPTTSVAPRAATTSLTPSRRSLTTSSRALSR